MTGMAVTGGRLDRRRARRTAALLGAFVIAAHGAVHLMGTALLWKLAEPGDLRFEDTVPSPGTFLAYVDGAAWAAAAVLFVVSAVLLIRHRPGWRRLVLLAVALSTVVVGAPLLAGSTQGAAGLVTNGLVAAGAAVACVAARRRA